jgi:hypothetical protein
MRSLKVPSRVAVAMRWRSRAQIALASSPCQHPVAVRTQIIAGWLLVVLLSSSAFSSPGFAANETPAPPASLDEIPSAKREDVTRLLRKVRQRHGDDAVAIQANLLLNAMQKGSVLATGVRVDRVAEAFGKRFLGFELETGVVFDNATRDRVARVQILWAIIMEPMLARLEDGLQVKAADGIMVQMQLFHRPYRSVDELRTSIEQPGTSETVRFYVLASDVEAVVRGELTARTLLERTRPTVDGAAITVTPPRDDLVLTPGPGPE